MMVTQAPQTGNEERDETMRNPLFTIQDEIRAGFREQGSELTPADVDWTLAQGFGKVLPSDVGKRVWDRNYGFVMENNEQRDKRKGKNK